jgi:predicted nucleotidyltransferase
VWYGTERLTRQAKHAIEECKQQAQDMAEDMMTKISMEMNKNSNYKHLILHLQRENARLLVLSPFSYCF